ncbi:hypothetical protein [uncultured Dialister sp.]|uniref:hypothetical protein n=1 Tax=uncultured Dialister sp. TaxID=278064 RepID=UPI0025E29B94|nr:hypothetical protein [uncultured Dialister sp.]
MGREFCMGILLQGADSFISQSESRFIESYLLYKDFAALFTIAPHHPETPGIPETKAFKPAGSLMHFKFVKGYIQFSEGQSPSE